jgi:hypothetical protein
LLAAELRARVRRDLRVDLPVRALLSVGKIARTMSDRSPGDGASLPWFEHTKVGGYPVLLRGLSPLIATVSTPLAAPVIAAAGLRGGAVGSARRAASLVTEAWAVTRRWVRLMVPPEGTSSEA